MGSVSSGTCAPTGLIRQPVDNRKLPSACLADVFAPGGLRRSEPQRTNISERDRDISFHSENLWAIGKRRPMPNALVVTFRPGAACWRLYSLRSTLLTMSWTKSIGKTHASGDLLRRAILLNVGFENPVEHVDSPEANRYLSDRVSVRRKEVW